MQRSPQNEIINLDPPPSNKRLSDNLDLAYQGISYARFFAKTKNSSTQPLVTDLNRLFALDSKIGSFREVKLTFNEAFSYFLLTNENLDVTDVKITTAKLSKYKRDDCVANCGELSDLVINFLRKHRVNIVKAYIFNSDHVIVLMDMDSNGDITKPFTLGDHCVLIDPLNNYACSIKEIYKWLQCYKGDLTKSNPHILSPFTPQNRLVISRSIPCFIDDEYNQRIVDLFCDRLDIIRASLNKYFNETASNELKKIITQHQNEARDENEKKLTNLELSRKLDKKIKKITNELQYFVCEREDNNNSLFLDILINMNHAFSSTYVYFETLIHFKPLFSHFINYINNNHSDEIELLKEKLENSFDRLFESCINKKDGDTLEVLFDYGYDLAGETLLTCAVKNDRNDILSKLGDQIKLLTRANKNGELPLQLAIVGKKTQSIWAILGKEMHFKALATLLNIQDGDGWSALHAASESGDEILVKEFLTHGSQAKKLTNYGYTALHLAAMEGHLNIVKRILDHDPSIINFQSQDGSTALFIAVNEGKTEVVNELLKRGADPEIKNVNGETPLNIIKNSQHSKMTKYIIEKYLKIEIRNRDIMHNDELGAMLKKFRR